MGPARLAAATGDDALLARVAERHARLVEQRIAKHEGRWTAPPKLRYR